MNFHYLISKNMLQEGLEHDQITVNQICNKATTRQPEVHPWSDDNCIKENYRISREKKMIWPTVAKRW